MKPTRTIPKDREGLIALAIRACDGTRLLGESVGLLQNSAARVAADLHTCIGTDTAAPATPDARGCELHFQDTRLAVRESVLARRQTLAAARRWCGIAIDVCKAWLGRRWNPRWIEAGLHQRTLRIPYDPVPMLIGLRNYLRTHPEHEQPALGITIGEAERHLAEVQSAQQDTAAARVDRATARQADAAARRRLTRRLTGLREELNQLLPPDDPRWYHFGFARPIDGRIPEPVAEVTVEPALPEQAIIHWPAAPRARRYRLSYHRPGDPTRHPLGLHHAPRVRLDHLPPGPLLLQIVACNHHGDSQPTTVELRISPRVWPFPIPGGGLGCSNGQGLGLSHRGEGVG